MKKVTLQEIAKSLNISRTTVWKVFSGHDGVSDALRDKVLTRARELGTRVLKVHASKTARPFFERRGYRMLYAQQVERRGVLLENFAMELALEGGEGHGSH